MSSYEKTIYIEEECKPLMTKHKMIFIMNALENGWTIKKVNHSYIFSKKHEGKREVFLESYLDKFIESNISGKN